MLQPRRPRPRREIPVEPIDATDLEAELRHYSPETRAAAEATLRDLENEVRLSTLIARARESGASPAVLEVIALLVLQGFASEDRDIAMVAAEPIAGAKIEDALLYGDDLLVTAVGRQP